MDGTDTQEPSRENPKRKGSVRTIGLVLLGVGVIAAAAVSLWFAVGPRGDAVMPEPRLVAGGERAFKLTPYASPRPIPAVEFEDGQGKKRMLADFRGKVVLLNLWATWCGPCRKEMPTLDRLQRRLGSPDFEVVALSIDRGGQTVVKSFFDEINVDALAIYVDATAEAGTKLGIIGVPTTLVLDRDGREVARYTGPAEWDRPEVIETIQRYLPPHMNQENR